MNKGNCDEIVVPVWSQGLLKDVILTRGWPDHIRLLLEATQDGPLGTIKRSAYWAREGQLLVAFGDNYYSSAEPALPSKAPGPNRACIRKFKRAQQREHLDYCREVYDRDERRKVPMWMHRSQTCDGALGHLAGWLLLNVDEVMDFSVSDETSEKGIIAMLNQLGAVPQYYAEDFGWADLGTPESYRQYLQGHTGGEPC